MSIRAFLPIACAALAGVAGLSEVSAGTLDAVTQRGYLTCGTNAGATGFSLPDNNGNWTGLDVDYCRGIAAAVFGDPTKVKFLPLTAKDRFTALQSGAIDVLVRSTTWTASRDSSQGLVFGATNFYDGQGFMVHKKLGVASAKELNGASVCVQQGTTTELNLADYFRSNQMKYDSVSYAGEDETIKAFESGRCDALTNDASGLYGERLRLADPDQMIVLPEIISKEPLTSVVRQGDDQWLNVVRWTHYAMVSAEELGLTRTNVGEMLKSDNPDIRRLLGVEGSIGKGFGLPNDWALKIIQAVGNYGEVFDRNVGEGSSMKIKRGLNELWNKGGLQYSPPIR